jgi:hypothetical protein
MGIAGSVVEVGVVVLGGQLLSASIRSVAAV